jgi:hypothetical protein
MTCRKALLPYKFYKILTEEEEGKGRKIVK